ncbi:translation initiation factor IF-2 [Buchnera aphidicola]|uniref:translation initiation factor IF-2 n=1 Tax=Buchnera aphidicola TaxID=9 RepID=UPI002093BE45|nr:translation initiation factor IF-2 [Buchnera aphidicola]USS94373.1 translation initiation factor IF-2 [Buchnera aphidicola (Sipha maydis)]WII23533.1 translation initiation factor IF-2 [Buchnera aphidicola (Sipha maydis)]
MRKNDFKEKKNVRILNKKKNILSKNSHYKDKNNIKTSSILKNSPIDHSSKKRFFAKKNKLENNSYKKNFSQKKNTSKNIKNSSIVKKKNHRFVSPRSKTKNFSFFKTKNKKKNNYLKNSIQTKFLKQKFIKPKNNFSKKIILSHQIRVFELANKMGLKSHFLIKKIFNSGISLTKNQLLDLDLAQLIVEEMGFSVQIKNKYELEQSLMKSQNVQNQKKILRPPIITIMGHVDHGKTSLLDCIRKTSTVSSEAGGITQSIGAYHITINGKKVTFLDTPGHAAFTSMRARGAQITDIIVLIIAADDGIMPQTIEAIKHAQLSEVPIIVAINKIDKNKINIEKIKNELMKYNILSEDLGGENLFVSISVKLKKGINKLLKSIFLQAELLDLSVFAKGTATGIVIESYLDKGKGPVSNILIKEGELKIGDIVLCGLEYGRIKSIRNENKEVILRVGPSIPVEILGLSGLPVSGEILKVVNSEKQAKEVSLYRKEKNKLRKFSKQKKINLENLFEDINKNKITTLNIILKTNSKGSLEAISHSLREISHEEVQVHLIHSSVGGINENDASLASSSNAIIIGFNVRADLSAKKIIEKEDLDLRYYSVIYTLINEVKSSIYGMLSPKYKNKIVGLAEVRSVFQSPKFGLIAGCMVTDGIIERKDPIRILRNNIVIYEGELESIRRFKEDVKKVRRGIECGIGIKNYNDIRVNDIIEVYKIEKIKRN